MTLHRLQQRTCGRDPRQHDVGIFPPPTIIKTLDSLADVGNMDDRCDPMVKSLKLAQCKRLTL